MEKGFEEVSQEQFLQHPWLQKIRQVAKDPAYHIKTYQNEFGLRMDRPRFQLLIDFIDGKQTDWDLRFFIVNLTEETSKLPPIPVKNTQFVYLSDLSHKFEVEQMLELGFSITNENSMTVGHFLPSIYV